MADSKAEISFFSSIFFSSSAVSNAAFLSASLVFNSARCLATLAGSVSSSNWSVSA